jgi:hypothetical protein
MSFLAAFHPTCAGRLSPVVRIAKAAAVQFGDETPPIVTSITCNLVLLLGTNNGPVYAAHLESQC